MRVEDSITWQANWQDIIFSIVVFLGYHWLGTCHIWMRCVLAVAHVVEHVLLWSCSRVEGAKGMSVHC